jgi:excisionase family DNA binding protein
MPITHIPQDISWGLEKQSTSIPFTGWTHKKCIAAKYGVSERTVDNWIAQKRIPYRKLGRSVRLNYEHVEEALQRFDRKAVS